MLSAHVKGGALMTSVLAWLKNIALGYLTLSSWASNCSINTSHRVEFNLLLTIEWLIFSL
jgi:hypothetical protein